MNRQVRAVGYALLILFGVAFLRLNWIQVVRAEDLANHPDNVRVLLKEHAVERGAILAAGEGQTLAESKPTPDQELKYLRTYSTGPLFAHVVGYYSIVYGRDRLERTYTKALTGRGGVLSMQDLGDRLLGRGEKGDTLVLSIHPRVQEAATKALGSRKGAVVALDPINGEVLALVSFPSFDPNPLSGHDRKKMRETWQALQADPNKALLNRATSRSYPPGSTFKVVTAAAALERGLGTDVSFPAAREYQPPQTDKSIRNFGGRTCGGDMADAMRISCNVYFARLGAELQRGALGNTARAFGFGEVPPIDIRAAASRMPSDDRLRSPAFAAQSAIGQFDVSATPLQMAMVAAGIAHDGKVMTPRIVREILDARGAQVRQTEAELWREAITPETATAVKELMLSVVEAGTGTAAQMPGVRVAGKTGTAQTQEGQAPHAWFIAFAPAESPRIAVAVVVEGGGDLGNEATGGRVAAPIAKQVLEAHRAVQGW
jgi:peptidoglycan glycosyltransferase